MHIHACMHIYISSSLIFFLISVQLFLSFQSIKKNDLLEKLSQRGVRSLRDQLRYRLEVPYYISGSR